MNQILVTEKLYITPELKKKKKIYRFEFFISVFLVCILFSYYIYAEYDKTKSEEVSKDILANMGIEKPKEDNTTIKENNILVAILDEDEEETQSNDEQSTNQEVGQRGEVFTNKSGMKYATVAVVRIPKINVDYPVIEEINGDSSVATVDALLKISPTKFWGSNPNEVGNYCIVGHNYRNQRFFSKVPTLENGDIIEITDLKGKTINYMVYDKYVVEPSDVSCTSQKTNGKKEITLITCTNDSKQRYIIKATEVL